MAQPIEKTPVERFTTEVVEALAIAVDEAKTYRHPEVQGMHLLLGLLRRKRGLATRILDLLEINEEAVRAELDRFRLSEWRYSQSRKELAETSVSREARAVFARAAEAADREHRTEIETQHILVALTQTRGRARTFLHQHEIDTVRVRGALEALPQESPQKPSQPTRDVNTGKGQRKPVGERLEAVPTHRDRPATEDELGRVRFAEVLGERMRRVRGEDTEAPVGSWGERWERRRRDHDEAKRTGSFMVHVHAPWGAGKSSLLNFLASDLRNREPNAEGALQRAFDFFLRRRRATRPRLSRWIVVDFNAWEHQRLATPWWWLLAAMQRSCGRELWRIDRRRWAWFWIRDLGWRIWNVRVATLTVVLLAGLVGLAWALDWFGLAGKSLTTLQAILLTAGSAAALATTLFSIVRGTGRWLAIGSAEAAYRFLKRARDPLGVYRRRFRWLVRSSARPIAIFIDDLDRCRSEYVVELLEGIQTLFAAEPVAYVVAADRAWLCQSFANAYDDFEQTVGDRARPLGFRFLEKTFQISMEIPPMSDNDRGAFWGKLVGASVNGASAEPPPSPSPDAFAEVSTQEEVEQHAKKLVADGKNPEEVFAGAVRRFNAPSIEQETETLLSKFAPLLERNPRSMKRLVNAYGFERDLLVRQGRFLDEEERRQLALLTILRLRWPLFADHLRDNPADTDLCSKSDPAPNEDHEFRDLFTDPELRSLFLDQRDIGTKLNRRLIEQRTL